MVSKIISTLPGRGLRAFRRLGVTNLVLGLAAGCSLSVRGIGGTLARFARLTGQDDPFPIVVQPNPKRGAA